MSGKGILDVPGIGAAHATDEKGVTGCTVIVAPKGAVAGVDVRGSAPGTRETDVLNPINLVSQVHAICLCGGSAFGLDAASGVMKRLAESGIGLNVGVGVVPIVPAAVLFDLALGPVSHPSSDMGYHAASEALASVGSPDARLTQGNVGAGCGATVGKVLGMTRAMKSGIGHASRQLPGDLIVAAVIAVNAVGQVRIPEGDILLAGCRGDDNQILNSMECLIRRQRVDVPPGTNTTIGIVATNARLTKVQATKVAQMAHDGLARCILPVHTMHDGDTIFAMATGEVEASVDLVGAIAAEVVSEAIVFAVKSARSCQGLPAWWDLLGPGKPQD